MPGNQNENASVNNNNNDNKSQTANGINNNQNPNPNPNPNPDSNATGKKTGAKIDYSRKTDPAFLKSMTDNFFSERQKNISNRPLFSQIKKDEPSRNINNQTEKSVDSAGESLEERLKRGAMISKENQLLREEEYKRLHEENLKRAEEELERLKTQSGQKARAREDELKKSIEASKRRMEELEKQKKEAEKGEDHKEQPVKEDTKTKSVYTNTTDGSHKATTQNNKNSVGESIEERLKRGAMISKENQVRREEEQKKLRAENIKRIEKELEDLRKKPGQEARARVASLEKILAGFKSNSGGLDDQKKEGEQVEAEKNPNPINQEDKKNDPAPVTQENQEQKNQGTQVKEEEEVINADPNLQNPAPKKQLFDLDDDDDVEIQFNNKSEATKQAAIQELNDFVKNASNKEEPANNGQTSRFTEEEKRAQDEWLANRMKNFRAEMEAIDQEEQDELDSQNESDDENDADELEEQKPMPKKQLFNLDDDDDVEIQFNNKSEATKQAAIQELHDFAKNISNNKEEPENTEPTVHFTDEEKRAQDQILETLMQNHRQNMEEIDREEQDELDSQNESDDEGDADELEEQKPMPKKQLFDLDDDDDVEIQFNNKSEATKHAAIQELHDFAKNTSNNKEEPENTEPAVHFTEEEKRAQDQAFEALMQSHRKNMEEIEKIEEEEQKAESSKKDTKTSNAQTTTPKKNFFEMDFEDEPDVKQTKKTVTKNTPKRESKIDKESEQRIKELLDIKDEEQPQVDEDDIFLNRANAKKPQTEAENTEQDIKYQKARLVTELNAIYDPDPAKTSQRIEAKKLLNETKAMPEDYYDGIKELFDETDMESNSRVAVFSNKVAEFAKMYKTNVDANDLAYRTTEAWTNMKSGDEKERANGHETYAKLFKSVLEVAFQAEKNAAYQEHRMTDFNEIVKNTNDLLRSSMYAFTDMYHERGNEELFNKTSFGGLTAKDMAELTAGESPWKMDQKSDEAWEIQSLEAKGVADEWKKENKPYEKMIKEMNALVEAAKKGEINTKEAYTKLTAAEWLLVNNPLMMVADPEDPLNPIPNWGNRYWKAITGAREAIGIPKHISTRDLIQGDYAEKAKAIESVKYNETQINDQILKPELRKEIDSMDLQKEQFAIQSAAAVLNDPKTGVSKEKNSDINININANEKGNIKINDHISIDHDNSSVRIQISIPSEDERKNMKNAPKIFSNFVVDKQAEIKLGKEDNSKQI